MKGVVHSAIAEKKDKGFGLVSYGKIDVQLCDRIENNLSQIRVDTVVSVQNPGDRRNTDTRDGRNLTKSNLANLRVFLTHSLSVPTTDFRWHDLNAFLG